MENPDFVLKCFHIDPVTQNIVPVVSQSLREDLVRGEYSIYVCGKCSKVFYELLTLTEHQIEYNHFPNQNRNEPGSSNEPVVSINEVRVPGPQHQNIRVRRPAGPASKTGYFKSTCKNEGKTASDSVDAENMGSGDAPNPANVLSNIASTPIVLSSDHAEKPSPPEGWTEPSNFESMTTAPPASIRAATSGSSNATQLLSIIIPQSRSGNTVRSTSLSPSLLRSISAARPLLTIATESRPSNPAEPQNSNANNSRRISTSRAGWKDYAAMSGLKKPAARSGSKNPASKSFLKHNAAKSGSKHNASKSGSKHNAARSSSKNHVSRSGSKNHVARSGSKNDAARFGLKNHAARFDPKNHAARSSSKNHDARSSSKNHAARSSSKNHAAKSGSRNAVKHQRRAHRVLSITRSTGQSNQIKRGGQNKKGYCEVCRMNLRSKKGLLEHNKTYHRPCQCTCRVCGSILNTKFHLWEHEEGHLVRVNGQVNRKLIQCPFCPKILMSKSSGRRHIQAFHTEGIFKCRYCQQILNTKFNLDDHQRDCVSIRRGVNRNGNIL